MWLTNEELEGGSRGEKRLGQVSWRLSGPLGIHEPMSTCSLPVGLLEHNVLMTLTCPSMYPMNLTFPFWGREEGEARRARENQGEPGRGRERQGEPGRGRSLPAVDEDDIAVADLLDGVLGDSSGRQDDLLVDVAVDACL